MVRKKRTGPGESSGEAPGVPGQGSSQRPETTQQHGGGRGLLPQQGARGAGQHQGRGGYQGRGGPPESQPRDSQGRGGYQVRGGYQGRGGPPEYQPRDNQGRGGYQGRGGPTSQHPGGPPEVQPRGYQGRGGPPSQHPGGGPTEYQGRGGPRPRGGVPQPHGGHGRGSVGSSVPSGPSRSVPELHQAPNVQHQAPVAVSPSTPGAGSSSQPAEAEVSTGQVQQQFQQLAIRDQSSTSQAVQMAPASSKSVRFPPRPGKGTYGSRCIVKANHFFAELPDKDLHHYDVSP